MKGKGKMTASWENAKILGSIGDPELIAPSYQSNQSSGGFGQKAEAPPRDQAPEARVPRDHHAIVDEDEDTQDEGKGDHAPGPSGSFLDRTGRSS